jgi:UDP-4-amino-4,6-dideoxy-N-acetyl-beta-L-altrosamine N-acetyltransferase
MINHNHAIELRPLGEADLEKVLTWRNMENVRMNMYTNHEIAWEEHLSWWNRSRNDPSMRLLIAVHEGMDAGVIIFTRYGGPDSIATWAFYAGNTRVKGIGSMMESAALDYAFRVLKVRKLECEVIGFNMPVVNMHLRFGFRIEGVFKDAYERDHSYHDIYRLAMDRKQWERFVSPMLAKAVSHRFSMAGKSFKMFRNVSAEDVSAFASATSDFNPVHFDDGYAESMGFKGRIAHGMLLGGYLSAFFANEFPGKGTVYLRQNLEFLKPVHINQDVEFAFKVLSHVGRKFVLQTQVIANGDIYVSGTAEVLAPKDFNPFLLQPDE